MTLDPKHDRLADYLAGEMTDPQRRAFERELANDPALAAEAHDLGAVQAMMRNEPARVTPTPIRRAVWPTVLRYAAVIALAFIAGFAARGGGGAVAPPHAHTDAREAAIARAYLDAPAESDVGRALIALSRGVR